ncbi:MAG: trypsin-like peptidase domain-containing protein [Candidatus Hydrogenedentes bacterium]|nr:trypsin-like peptidase domain-containing protein [Candidatus Hydrogenedentota bacterium]
MFTKAIENAAGFTRAIHSISRNYGSTVIQPGAATLFFVNADGWALTCGHVVRQLLASDKIMANRQAFANELNDQRGEKKERVLLRELEKKYNCSKNEIFEQRNSFVNCVDGTIDAEWKSHSCLDIALIHFRNFSQLHCDSFPTFAANGDGLKQGKFLCRLGFPFAEFSNYAYDDIADTINWTDMGQQYTPCFPIEGMVTRYVRHADQINCFEMSTPGLRGQSGGPAFDTDGVIWGMQFATNHLDLDFDVNQEVLRCGSKKRVTSNAFLHVGLCIHVNALKSFMKEHGVHFQEA